MKIIPFMVLATLVLMGCTARPTMTMVPNQEENFEVKEPGVVLILLTEASQVRLANGSTHQTGTFFGEMMTPVRKLQNAGYTLAIATPTGKLPTLDAVSLEDQYLKPLGLTAEQAKQQFNNFIEQTPRMSLSEALSLVHSYQAIFMPGGQGLMSDLIDNKEAHSIIQAFGDSPKPVGLICHASIILARMPDEMNPFEGRLISSVAPIEEWYIETFVMDGDAEIRGIRGQLKRANMRPNHGRPGGSHAIRDGFLVSSQNPFSDDEFSELFLKAIEDWRNGATPVTKNKK